MIDVPKKPKLDGTVLPLGHHATILPPLDQASVFGLMGVEVPFSLIAGEGTHGLRC
jgi:hypothetical protein